MKEWPHWRHTALIGAKPLLLLMFLCTLPGCEQQSEIVVKFVCLRVNEYDRATQDKALAEFNALPQGSALRQFIGDYKRLRDQVRACRERSAAVR